jgi:2-succinyl-6-hydroxy-2,4-cyclohexadiene-1-carboxylate synthase
MILNYSKTRDNGPIIVLLHGFLGCHRDWEPCMVLLKKKYTCLAVDLPGHGSSIHIPLDVRWSMEWVAETVVQTLQSITDQPAFLVGYSMGGRLALYLALRYRQYFKKCVIESASPGLATESERAQRRIHDQKIAHSLINEPFSAFLKKWYSQPLFQSLREHPKFNQMVTTRQNETPTLLAKLLVEMGTGMQPALWDELSNLKIPLCLVNGEKDVKFIAISEEMRKIKPAIHHCIVSEAGHNVHFEQPAKFVTILNNFLTDP